MGAWVGRGVAIGYGIGYLIRIKSRIIVDDWV